ncbi:hypothetical protein GOODEAATRI_019327 [Goodea atripinnis]|uniref:Proline-rich transmembrane protein 2 n=1 Tax=Goodea atripinnis TaxID=208336 RepID=A0ABV0MTD8_9TELE
MDQDGHIPSQAVVSVPCGSPVGEELLHSCSSLTDTRPSHSKSKGELVIVINEKLKNGTCNGIHPGPTESTSSVISSPPTRQHSISYPHHGKTRKGSRAGSIGYTAFSPRPSLSRHSSIATNPPLDRTKVKDYLLLSVLACFCPVWPINIVGFVYSIMVRAGGVKIGDKCWCEQQLTNGLIFSSSPRTASSRETWTAPCVWDVWPRCCPLCR